MKYYFINQYGVKIPYPTPEDPDEDPSNTLEFTYIAGEPLIRHMVVVVQNGDAFIFKPEVEANYGKVIGLAKYSANPGDELQVVCAGTMISPGWNLVADQLYYAGGNGAITGTPPSTGNFIRVGVAVNHETMKLEFSDPILLT